LSKKARLYPNFTLTKTLITFHRTINNRGHWVVFFINFKQSIQISITKEIESIEFFYTEDFKRVLKILKNNKQTNKQIKFIKKKKPIFINSQHKPENLLLAQSKLNQSKTTL